MNGIAPNGKSGAAGRGKAANFPRSARLLRRSDFERVYKQGRRHFAAHLTVFYLGREAGEDLRVGLTVSRALGGAVARNRMKRRLREAIRVTRPLQGLPADVVINPKKSVLTADFVELLKEVSGAFALIARKLEKRSG